MSEQLWAVREKDGSYLSERYDGGPVPLLYARMPVFPRSSVTVVPVTLIETAELDALRAEVERLRGLKGAASSAWHAIDARPEPGARIVVMDSDGGGATLFRVEADGRLRRADDETDDGGCWWEAVEESGWVWMRLPEGARLWFERGAELDALRAEVERLRADAERLDWLDAMNRVLNRRYGTSYGWKLVTNHHVNRLFLGHLAVDLHDSEGGAQKLPSCRAAIDAHRQTLRAALKGGEG